MNDLDMLRESFDAPLPSLSELSSAREVLIAGIAPGGGQGPDSFPAPAAERRGTKRPRPARRIVIGSVTVAAAAAITAGALVAGTHVSAHGTPQAARSGGTADAVVPAQLTAKQVLDRAAAAALRQAVVVPRADQFVYTKVDGGAPGTARSLVYQDWLSVDGTRNSLITQTSSTGKVTSWSELGCVNGSRTYREPGYNGQPYHGPAKPKQAVPLDGPVVTEPCTASPAYFPDMPTNPRAMAGYLARTQGIQLGNLNNLAKTVGFMLQSDYILPAQRAALDEFLATTPGLVVEQHVHDISGRPGVGVGWSFEGGKAINIFDPTTYAYLGLTTWGIGGQEGGDALVQTAIVNHPGQLP